MNRHFSKPFCWSFSICNFSGLHISNKFVFRLRKFFWVVFMVLRDGCTQLTNSQDADADRERGVDGSKYAEL